MSLRPETNRYNLFLIQGKSLVGDYQIYDHTYDAIVVGAGGAGLRVSAHFYLGCVRISRGWI